MEVRLIRRTPSPIQLCRKCACRSHRPEEIHAPFRSLSLSLVDVEVTQRDLHGGYPFLLVFAESCRRRETLGRWICDVGSGEDGTCCADFGGVVDPGAEGLVVGSYFEFEVILWVVDSPVLSEKWLATRPDSVRRM